MQPLQCRNKHVFAFHTVYSNFDTWHIAHYTEVAFVLATCSFRLFSLAYRHLVIWKFLFKSLFAHGSLIVPRVWESVSCELCLPPSCSPRCSAQLTKLESRDGVNLGNRYQQIWTDQKLGFMLLKLHAIDLDTSNVLKAVKRCRRKIYQNLNSSGSLTELESSHPSMCSALLFFSILYVSSLFRFSLGFTRDLVE